MDYMPVVKEMATCCVSHDPGSLLRPAGRYEYGRIALLKCKGFYGFARYLPQCTGYNFIVMCIIVNTLLHKGPITVSCGDCQLRNYEIQRYGFEEPEYSGEEL
jgi:hypothetical protein